MPKSFDKPLAPGVSASRLQARYAAHPGFRGARFLLENPAIKMSVLTDPD